MRIKCLHGYFIFEESESGQISRYMSMTGLSIVPKNNHYTFESLQAAKKYSIKGNQYLGALATKTFEGEPWEVMRQNGLAYNFNTGLVVPINSITQAIKIATGVNYMLSNGLILPGSLTDGGNRVKEYSAWYLFNSAQYRFSEVVYE